MSLLTWPCAGSLRPASTRAAAEALASGLVVLLPTESSFALSADARSEDAVERVRAIKGRGERGKPLLLLAASLDQAMEHAALDADAMRLARAWPAPLTLAVPALDDALARRLGGELVALRVPAEPHAREVIDRLGWPVTGTSANAAGAPPVLDAAEAEAAFGSEPRVAGILDVGRLPGGAPSTLVAVERGRVTLLRDGAFPRQELEALLGRPLDPPP